MTQEAVVDAPRRRWTRIGAVAGVTMGLAIGGGVAIASTAHVLRQATPVTDSAEFVGVTPVRVLDTRPTDGGPIGVPAAGALGQQQSIDVAIAGLYGIPADATSVAVNVTIDDDATLKSFLTVYPTGETRPNASTNNAEPGLVMANSAIFELGTGGKLTVFNQQGLVHVIIDVTGYFVEADAVAASIETDAIEYATGAEVTYTGTGWSGCESVRLDLFGPAGAPVDMDLTPTDGELTGIFAAPDAGNYLLVARSTIEPWCTALTSFVVVEPDS
jgi:hypothetical protein